jgi:hypothetical protein
VAGEEVTPDNVAVIIVVPLPTAVATPEEELIVATLLFEELQATVRFDVLLPLL